MSAYTPLPSKPVWHSILSGFVPERAGVLHRLIPALPFLAILLGQFALSIRLDNSAFTDEAVYIENGRWILEAAFDGTANTSHPETFFSGAPQLYPVMAAAIDMVGGLSAVRLFSTLLMLVSTACVFGIAKQLFNNTRTGLIAALIYGWSAPVLFIGHLATFDAMSFTLLSATLLFVIRSTQGHAIIRSLAAGVTGAAAVLVKYAAAIDLPFIMLTPVVLMWGTRRIGGIARAAVASAMVFVVLGVSLFTWAHPLLQGLAFTTTERVAMKATSTIELMGLVTTWSGSLFVITALGFVLLARKRPLLAVFLISASFGAITYQVSTGEAASLQKHIVLGLIFAAPLAGYAINTIIAKTSPIVLLGLMLGWFATTNGIYQSSVMFDSWSSTTAISTRLEDHIDNAPGASILADNPEPLMYALRDETSRDQWSATWGGGFYYDNLTGMPAYEAALDDHHFDFVVLDGTTQYGSALEPKLSEFGYTKFDQVYLDHDNHLWEIYKPTPLATQDGGATN